MRVVLLGPSVTSLWGNGHVTSYCALMRELDARGHDVVFLERDVPSDAADGDLADRPFGRTYHYSCIDELPVRFADEVRGANLVAVGSSLPEGIAIGEWVCDTACGTTAFYDMDTPATIAGLEHGDCTYLSPALVSRYDLYLSFTGGPTLERLARSFGAKRTCALYRVADLVRDRPCRGDPRWILGSLGPDLGELEPQLEALLVEHTAACRIDQLELLLAATA